jgi:hypothetical protein
MDLESTIVAISSAQGYAKRAVVRISGSKAFSGVEKLGVKPKFGSVLSSKLDIGENKLPVLVGAFPEQHYFGKALFQSLPNQWYRY